MVTTVHFAETITDKRDKSVHFELEFGRSSFYGGNLIYLKINGKRIILDETIGREIASKMHDLASYLGYDKG